MSEEPKNNLAKLQFLASLAVLGLAVVHNLVQPIDNTTLALLVLLLAIWFLPYVKSVEIPGAGKIEFEVENRFAEAAKAAAKVPVAAERVAAAVDARAAQAVARDAGSALVELRRRIESAVRVLEAKHGLPARGGLMSRIVALAQQASLDRNVVSGLLDLVALGNLAVHGAPVRHIDPADLLEIGERLVRALEEKSSANRTA